MPYIKRHVMQPISVNACSIRNAIDRARLRRAARLFEPPGAFSRSQLQTSDTHSVSDTESVG